MIASNSRLSEFGDLNKLGSGATLPSPLACTRCIDAPAGRSKTCFGLAVATHTPFILCVYNLSHSSDTKKLEANTTLLLSAFFIYNFNSQL